MRMVTAIHGALLAMAITVVDASADSPVLAKHETPQSKAEEPPRPHRVRATQSTGPHPTIRVHTSILTRWQLLESAAGYDLGKRNDYEHSLDPIQRKRLRLQPLDGASRTNVTIESVMPMVFDVEPVDSAHLAVRLVMVRPVDPTTGEMIPHPRCERPNSKPDHDDDTTERMEEDFATYPAKKGSWEMGGYKIEGRLSEQHREGDTLKFRYRLDNEGLRYSAAIAQVMPLGSDVPLADVEISVDGGRTFPLEMPHNGVLEGSIYVKASAAQLVNGITLRFLPSRAIPPATVGFPDDPINQGRLSIQAEGLVGAISLKNAADQTDFTSMVGAGARVVYGFSKYLSAEVSLSVLSTQQAQFNDESTAEAITTRVLFGGMLSFGEGTYVPYLRVGIGGRLSSYKVSSEDDGDLRGSGIYQVGGGIDAWLGDGFVVGISGHVVSALGGGGDESLSFEAGVHAGFAWKP